MGHLKFEMRALLSVDVPRFPLQFPSFFHPLEVPHFLLLVVFVVVLTAVFSAAVLSIGVFAVFLLVLGVAVVLADPSAFHLFSQIVVLSLASCPSRGAYPISV
jgi:hypothetical protein